MKKRWSTAAAGHNLKLNFYVGWSRGLENKDKPSPHMKCNWKASTAILGARRNRQRAASKACSTPFVSYARAKRKGAIFFGNSVLGNAGPPESKSARQRLAASKKADSSEFNPSTPNM